MTPKSKAQGYLSVSWAKACGVGKWGGGGSIPMAETVMGREHGVLWELKEAFL